MNKQIEALKMAIVALEDAQMMIGDGASSIPDYFLEQINACKEALASHSEALESQDTSERDYNFMRDLAVGSEELLNKVMTPLSDDEIALIWANNSVPMIGSDFIKVVRAIEQALKEKNYG